MIKNYLLIALRNLVRHKGYSFINIFGLTLGIACCTLILLWVRDELSYDSFHEHADRIVRVTQDDHVVTPALVAPFLQRNLPEVQLGTRLFNATQFGPFVVRQGEKLFQEQRFFFADSTIFEIFSFPLLSGDSKQALARPQTVVLSRSMARKYFGDEDPLGKILVVNSNSEYEVTGVIDDIPHNSHLQFDFLGSYTSLKSGWARNETTWDSANLMSYFLLSSSVARRTLETKIADLIQSEFAAQLEATGSTINLLAQPLQSIHLHSKLFGESNADILHVYGFSAIAVLILIIACINYMNLATARSARRAKEVGMRKVLGAVRSQISKQFFGESALVTAVALFASVGLIQLLLPSFNTLSGKEVTLDYGEDVFLLSSLTIIGIAVSVLAGFYPALLLSRFKPVSALRKSSVDKSGHSSFRNKLVVFQFSVSIALIVATLVVKSQLEYVRSTNLGFEPEQVLILPIGDPMLQRNYGVLKNELLQHVGILSAAAADGYPGNQLGGYMVGAEGLRHEERPAAGGMIVDKDIVEALGLELLAGNGFPKSYTPEQGFFYVINETLLGKIGWSSEEALGKELNLHGRKGPVVGVAKDFHFMSLHNPIHPLAMFLSPLPTDYEYLLVKLRTDNVSDVLKFVEGKWKALALHRPFEYRFLDLEFDALYRTEERMGQIFFIFSGLAIVIACLGLFGLASFMVELRTKEIGIRKVLGASVTEILLLLGKKFLMLVGVAFVIAAPVSYFVMRSWLQDFAYRIDIGPEVFLLGGLAVLLIALGTVSLQSLKAAISNPIRALRHE